MKPLSVGCLIFEQMDQIDFTGPFEVLSRMPHTTVQIIGKGLSPVRDVQGLGFSPDVSIAEAGIFDETFAASYPEITQLQQATANIADVAFASNYVNIIDAPAGAEMISSVAASPNLFTLLGVEPIIGRSFTPDEAISDHPNVVLLSYDIWQRSFAGDRNVLGRTVRVGSTPETVIGVMPRQFSYPMGDIRPEVWVPIERTALASDCSSACRRSAPSAREFAGTCAFAIREE